MRVLVLDGNENQAVACVRSLARAGHEVWVGAPTGWSKAGWSRYCRGSFIYPTPEEGAENFVLRVVDEVRRGAPGALVLPMTERTTLPLSALRERIYEVGGRLVLPSHDTLLRAFDKSETTRLAASIGVCVPRTFTVNDLAHARTLADELQYPVVLKPRSSEEVHVDGRIASTGAPDYARSAGDFLAAYKTVAARASSVLVQEFVEGEGAGYFALMRHGELRAEFAHRRLRDVRPTGSGSALRESETPGEKVRSAALGVLRALEWHGVAMVEFRVRVDGTPVFLEVNGRFWNSLALAVYSGVDFPRLLAEMAEHGDVQASMPTYRPGIRCRWTVGDFRHLVEVMRGPPLGYAGRFPTRLGTLSAFLKPIRGTFHDNFEWRDPLPELGDWIHFLFRKLPAGARKRVARKSGHAEGRYSHT